MSGRYSSSYHRVVSTHLKEHELSYKGIDSRDKMLHRCAQDMISLKGSMIKGWRRPLMGMTTLWLGVSSYYSIHPEESLI